MNYTKTHNKHEQLPVSSERTLPAAPFPRKYMHSVVDELEYAVQAVYALRSAGYDARDIHVMSCWDFAEAVERRQQQGGLLSKILMRLYSLIDDGLNDVYLHEALQGHHILMVRLSNCKQVGRVHEMLTAHHVHLIKYVDTWTVTDLSPAPEFSRAFSSAGYVEWRTVTTS